MSIPFIDMWNDNNITLKYDLGDGYLMTQGGDYRYKEKPRSVLVVDGQTAPTQVAEEPQPAGLLNEDPLANIRVPEKPQYFRASQPSLQEQNLRQAEQELRQAKIDDAQTGSEGYEKKEDGIFSRIANWGNSVSDYLFGKDKSTAETQVPLTSDAIKQASLNAAANQIMNDLNDRYEDKQKEEQGILGYYGNKLLGKQGQQEWQDFKNDWKERGIGALTGRASNLMETMARSPYANMVDPTTVLGGQRTMVNDIDSYFNQRGLGALRNDLLKQDLVDRQTLLGQAERYAAKTPEERAVIDQFMQSRRAAGYQGVGPKNSAAAANQEARELIAAGTPADHAYQVSADRWGVTPDEARAGKSLAPTAVRAPITQVQAGQRRVAELAPILGVPGAIDQYRQETGDMETPDNVLVGRTNPNVYQPKTLGEKVKAKQMETSADLYAKRIDKDLQDVEDPEYDATMRDGVMLLDYMKDPNNAKLVGGAFNDTMKKWSSSLGYSGEDQSRFLSSFLRMQRGMHAKAIRQINQSGATNENEQRYARESILDLNKDAAYNISMLERTISDMALAKAMKRDEAYMIERGGSKLDNDTAIRKKYGNMIHNPKVYIDPELVDAYAGRDVVYMLDSNGNWAAGMEE